MVVSGKQQIYTNPTARAWKYDAKVDPRIRQFHETLPSWSVTPLLSLDSVAKAVGVNHVFLKDESNRAGLPAFKILGASWTTHRLVAEATQNEVGVSLDILAEAARKKGIKLFAATDGNHGRATARMAKSMGVECDIFVPLYLDRYTKDLIASEGCRVFSVGRDYDTTLEEAVRKSKVPNGILVQDTAFEGYIEPAKWVVDGYSTMMVEVDEQVRETTGGSVDLVIAPVGCGSFAQSAINFFKSQPYECSVWTVESDQAPCLLTSLINGQPTKVETFDTILDGLNCPTVSVNAWPILKEGVEASVAITDVMADDAVKELAGLNVAAGPCGASGLAALKLILEQSREAANPINADSTVVLFCTEGARPYKLPETKSET